MERRLRNMLVEKENDHKNINKRDHDFDKIDRLLKIKKINGAEDNRDLRGIKHSKELREIRDNREVREVREVRETRGVSRSFGENVLRRELRPLSQTLNNTQQYCQLYAHGIIERSNTDNQALGSFLNSHDIDKGLRARMLDWMIEVTSSYKFTSKTFFTGVHLMDRYFKAEQQRLPITKLHIVGVSSMLIATKMDEVYPLKIKTVYDKIVHKKISKNDIVEMESRITHKLDFVLDVWSFYDLALLKLHENWQAKNSQALKEIEELCGLIGKFVMFNAELYAHYPTHVLAEALLKAAGKVYGSERARLAMGEHDVLETSRDQHTCMELMLQTVHNFKSGHRNLSNIYKFANEAALARLQDHLKNY